MKNKQKYKLKLKVNQHVFYLDNVWFPIATEGFYCSHGELRYVVRDGTILRSVFGYYLIKDENFVKPRRIYKTEVFLSRIDAHNYATFSNNLRDAIIGYGTRKIIHNVFGE